MPTIYDVAELAGVSITTVSRVLNDRQNVRPETRERVKEAVKALNYFPDPAARSLTLKNKSLIALIVPDISNPFYAEMARGVQDICDQQEYSLLISSTDGLMEKEKACIERLGQQLIDGICMVRYLADESNLALLENSRLPVVIIGSQPKSLTFDVVGTFGTGTALREILKGLISRGRCRIGYVGGPLDSLVGRIRLRQYKDAVSYYGMTIDDHLMAINDFSTEGGLVASLELLDSPKPPDVVFAANDVMAIGALKAARARGFEVPKDVAVIGCDDIDAASLLQPSLTSIRFPKYDLGKTAAELLFRRMSDGKGTIQQLSLQTKPVFRESTNIKDRSIVESIG